MSVADGHEQRRKAGWPRWFSRLSQQTFLRRPVSTARARGGWIVLFGIAIGYAAYSWQTSDEAIRRRAIRFLQLATGGEVEVSSARFSLFDGIELRNVRVSSPLDPQLNPAATTPAQREIFSAAAVRLIHNPWKLPAGALSVDEIIAIDPRLTIVQNTETGRFNWQSLSATTRERKQRRALAQRPMMRLRDAEVVVVTVDHRGQKRGATLTLDADVRPHPIVPTAYLVDIRKTSQTQNRGRMVYDPVAGTISDTPIVGLGTIRSLLPRPYQDFFARISLSGDIRSDRMRYGGEADSSREFGFELRDVSCVLPMSMLRSGDVSGKPHDGVPRGAGRSDPAAFELRQVAGQLRFVGQNVSLDLSGLLNGARSRVRGTLRDIARPLDEIGLDLVISSERLMLPEGETRERIISGEAVPQKLSEFLKEFDPHGALDLECTLRRTAGAGQRVDFGGTLRARGCSASYEWFPYEIRGLTGEARFNQQGIRLIALRGRHGSAAVQIDGHLAAPVWWTQLDLTIAGSAVAFDVVLYRALSEPYRRMWEHLDPRGLARVSLHLSRAAGNARDGPKPWQTTLTADLRDARICYDGFPYSLENVQGRFRLSPDGVIRIEGLTGQSASGATAPAPKTPATVRVDGMIGRATSGEPGRVELRVEARALRLDDRLTNAMPTEAQGAFAQFQPSGEVHLLGRVFLDGSSPNLQFDLDAELEGGQICYAEFPYRIENVSGNIRITPTQTTLIDVTGSRGESRFRARGNVTRTARGYAADLTIGCRALRLNDELRQALTPTLREAWEMLSPDGTIDLMTQLHRVVEGERVVQRYRTEVEAQGGRLRYRGFPLPLDDVRGQVTLSDRRVELTHLDGRCGGGRVRVSGSIDLGTAGPSGALRAEGEGLTFDESLAAALPEAWRPRWRALQPHGKWDLLLDVLRFNTDAGGRTSWEWSGRLTLHDAAFRVGMNVSDAIGEIAARGSVGDEFGLRLDAEAHLGRLKLGMFDLRDLTMRATIKPGSTILSLSECNARAFGGHANGECDVTFGPQRTEYALSMNIAEARLSDYLSTLDKPGSPPRTARGLIYGKLFLRGEAGRDATRRGGGEFFLREAQVWKLPLMLEIFRVLNLAPDENMFHDAWIQCFLEGRTLRFTKLDLQGRAIALLGAGTMNTDTDELNIRLVAGSPHRLKVPLLSELVEGASRDLFEVLVTGTPTNPQIESRPMRDLRRTLESLFPPKVDESQTQRAPPGR